MTLSSPRHLPRRSQPADASGPRAHRVASLVALSRPNQWHKNALVFGAPLAAGALEQPGVAWRTVAMAAAFVAASTATYAANDLADIHADRAHATKRLRPLASGALTPTAGRVWGYGAALIAIAIALVLGAPSVLVVAIYLTLTYLYSRWLKRVPIVEIVVVAAGFVLRALSGAVVNGLGVSSWFLLVCLFGALYLVLAKRTAESGRAEGLGPHVSRDVLEAYTGPWLQQMMTVALAGTVVSYALWALQDVGTDVFAPVLAATVVPFLVALMRYALLVSRGVGEAPETDVLHDRFTVVTVVLWAAMCFVGLYVA